MFLCFVYGINIVNIIYVQKCIYFLRFNVQNFVMKKQKIDSYHNYFAVAIFSKYWKVYVTADNLKYFI